MTAYEVHTTEDVVTLTAPALEALLQAAEQRGRVAQLTWTDRTGLAALYGYEHGLDDGRTQVRARVREELDDLASRYTVHVSAERVLGLWRNDLLAVLDPEDAP